MALAGYSRAITVGTVLAVLAGSVQQTAQAAEVASVGSAAQKVSSDAGPQRAAKWRPILRKADGKRLDVGKHRDGHMGPKLVIGERYLVRGAVPKPLRAPMAGRTLRLQAQPVAGGGWRTATKVKVNRAGKYRDTFTVRKWLLHEHRFRLAAPSSVRRSLMATTTSDTTTATGASEFVYTLVNTTGDNLVVTLPVNSTGQVSGSATTYTDGTFNLGNNQTMELTYTNPPTGTNVVWTVTKQNCVGNCTTYRTDWSYQPWGNNWTECSTAVPQFNSGSNWTVTLGPQSGSGYNGYIQGEGTWASTPGNPGKNNNGGGKSPNLPNAPTCSFQLVEAFDEWVENNPGWATVVAIAAVVVVAIVVAASVATGGAADVVVGDAVATEYAGAIMGNEAFIGGDVDLGPGFVAYFD